ncbi:hypothetical protein GCM10022225_07670 [Plantactinospora mayteni]|uniref:Uncharacterized protein n=1 Tax=Plantactinospora mayteni TaxID=566021 RepID=A0ABQ4EJV8_9ACTN|nr:hypothetical protein [Plantactinospora mayteni]GIG94487.1 hypothetical protein Pma05_10600 [Plantactinospora mayteni]
MTGTAQVAILRSVRGYLSAAERWTPGDHFPVLAGPPLERYRAIQPDRRLPRVVATKRAGRVVSIGGPVSRAAARLLAVATARPHRHVPAQELLGELANEPGSLSAVVGLPAEFALVGDWPGRDGVPVGILTARSPAALSGLIYRSLTVEAGVEDRTFVASHPLLPGAAEADAASFAELGQLRERRAALVMLSGQGRECCTSLLDGMICGRARPLGVPLPLVAGERATPCVSGAGCFRTDLTPADLLPAAEIHARLVLVQSCSAIAVGTNAYPAALSVTLGLLDGTAVAIVGALGVHLADRYVPGRLQDALAEGVPLGEIVGRLSEAGGGTALTRFGLLGDPALVLPAPAALAAVRRDDPARSTTVITALIGLRKALDRLDRLRWLDVELPDDAVAEVRSRMRRLGEDSSAVEAPAQLAELSDALGSVQVEVVDRLVARIHGPGWDPGWRSRGFRQVRSRLTNCPACGRQIAADVVLRHPVEPALHLRTLQCRRCGDVWWTTGSQLPPIEIAGPLDLRVRRYARVPFVRELVSRTPDELRVTVGYAFRRRKNLGLPPGSVTSCVVPPYGRYQLRHEIDLVTDGPPADTHSMLVVALSGGVLQTATAMMQLTERPSGTTPDGAELP